MANVVKAQPEVQREQQQQMQEQSESIEQANREIKTDTDVAIESSRPVEVVENSGINPNSLQFRVTPEDRVEALILNPKGEIIKTIPPSDLQQMMAENSIPSTGRLFEGRA